MSGFFDWSAWRADLMTVWILLWVLQFALIEWFGASSNNMVTCRSAHLVDWPGCLALVGPTHVVAGR
jgi:hypothetical protein